MDELTECHASVVEYKGTHSSEKLQKYVDNCTGTDPVPPSKSISVETNRKCDAEVQTIVSVTLEAQVNEQLLVHWLRKIAPLVETELRKGQTPLFDGASTVRRRASFVEDAKVQTYQKISVNATENSHGLATWLSVHTNNAPALVVTTVAPHGNWCEHVQQSLKVYVPRRVQNFVVFTELKSVPLKACLRSLCTNAHNKNIFAGSTLDGDIYVWQYEHTYNATSGGSTGGGEVHQLHSVTSPYGFAVAMEWLSENRLLTCHQQETRIVQWRTGKQMLKEAEYSLQSASSPRNEITTIVCLTTNDFVVGTKDGSIYHCWTSSVASLKQQLEITPLRRHQFAVSTLLNAHMFGQAIVISCDLSGHVYYHDLRQADEDSTSVIVKLPLPFKNGITCSRDANVIYSPGIDGSLQCYRMCDGIVTSVKGALQGNGQLIKSSDNGCWLITGLYSNEFQIFYLEH